MDDIGKIFYLIIVRLVQLFGNFWITDPKVISLLRHLERVLLSPSYLFHLDLELYRLHCIGTECC